MSTTFEELMESARATNRHRDATERKLGMATPLQAGPKQLIATVMAALDAGLKRNNLDAIAEAAAMLEDFLRLACSPEQLKKGQP